MDRIGILLTGWPGQQRFWLDCLRSFEGCKWPVVFTYDDQFLPAPAVKLIHSYLPQAELCAVGDSNGPHGLVPGGMICMKIGGQHLQNKCEWLYKTSLDATCWRWRNLEDVVSRLANVGYKAWHYGTAWIVAETTFYNEVFSVPHHKVGGTTEGYFARRLLILGKPYLQIPRWDSLSRGQFDLEIGRIHVHGEWAQNNHYRGDQTGQIGQLWPREQKIKEQHE